MVGRGLFLVAVPLILEACSVGAFLLPAGMAVQRRASSPAVSLQRRGGVRCAPSSLRMGFAATPGTDADLKERIATFYDQSSSLWEDVWGEHMHMGRHARPKSLTCTHDFLPLVSSHLSPPSLSPPSLLPPPHTRTAKMSTDVVVVTAAARLRRLHSPPPFFPFSLPSSPLAGHYGWDGKEDKSDSQAQIDMIDRLLEFGQVTPASIGPGKKVLDVGCGVGGSTRHIVKKLGCSASGITLSPVQAEHAAERSARCGMTYLTDFQVGAMHPI